jgi:hypothetical protein
MNNLHQKSKFALSLGKSSRFIYQTSEKPSVQTESSDQQKVNLNDTQTYEGRKKIAAEAGKKIQEMIAGGKQEEAKALRQLLQEYYASGRDLEKAKQASTNLYQKLDQNISNTTASGIIKLSDSPFSALSKLNANISQPKLSGHTPQAPQLTRIVDLDSEEINNPIIPQAIAQRDGGVTIVTPENGPRLNPNPPSNSQPINLAEVEITGEDRQLVTLNEIPSKVGNEQYLEALLKFKGSTTDRVDFRTKDNQPAYIQKEGRDFKVYLI